LSRRTPDWSAASREGTIRDWGLAGGYLRTAEDASVFSRRTRFYLLLHQ